MKPTSQMTNAELAKLALEGSARAAAELRDREIGASHR